MPKFVIRRSTLITLALAATGLSVASFAQPESASKPPAPKHSATELPSDVEHTMEAMDDAVETLSKQLGKPEALQTIWRIEELAQHAKEMVPEHLKGGATPENLTGYRKAQVDLMRLYLNLESDILDNKPDDAKEVLGQVDDLQKSAHRQFKARKPRN